MTKKRIDLSVDPDDYPNEAQEEVLAIEKFIERVKKEAATLFKALNQKTDRIQESCDCPKEKLEKISTKNYSELERCSLCKNWSINIFYKKEK